MTSFLTMTFLLRTLRDWFDKLEAIALQNPALLQNKTVRSFIKTQDYNLGIIEF